MNSTIITLFYHKHDQFNTWLEILWMSSDWMEDWNGKWIEPPAFWLVDNPFTSWAKVSSVN